jgi:alkaline phosphatase D
MIDLQRRRLLRLAGTTALAGLAAPVLLKLARAETAVAGDPFTLGIASGEPDATSVVLWTRLATDPVGGGMPPVPVTVAWEIAEDERMTRVVARGEAAALPDAAHSVHVEAGGLSPDRWYWYRFRAGGHESAVGRTRTLPAEGAPVPKWRLVVGNCQQYEQGYYTAWRHAADAAPDLVVHLGDYIYENSWGPAHVRSHGTARPTTLEEYRDRYALYKSDPDLQAAQAAAPWCAIWDDHEVEDNYAGGWSKTMLETPRFLARRKAAYQAYWEHMPLRASARLGDGDLRIYRTRTIGGLARLVLLDTRQYRDVPPCPKGCLTRDDPNRTMLGEAQGRWLDAELARHDAAWTLVAQGVMVAPLDRSIGGRGPSKDTWAGFPAARERFLAALGRARSPAVLTGDFHSAWVNDLHEHPSDPASRQVATEFILHSITSHGHGQDEIDAWLPANPHVRFAAGDQHGYGLVELDAKSFSMKLETVSTIQEKTATRSTLAAFTVEAGAPQAHRA